jgi:hypothetical protein
MKTITLGLMFGVVAAVSSFIACSQAKVQCVVGHAGSGQAYAAKYILKTTPAPACAVPGDAIGFETYHPAGGGDDGKQPDFSKPALVAIQADSMGLVYSGRTGVDADATHKLYSLGAFSTVEPGTDGFCAVNIDHAKGDAEQHFPHVAAVPPMGTGGDATPGSPEEPETDIKYVWDNVKVYVTADAQGTQFKADLKYTEIDTDPMTNAAATCEATYSVIGVWPQVTCGNTVMVDDGMGGQTAKTCAMPTDCGTGETCFQGACTTPIDALCCPNADPNGGRVTGSGINPDFPLKCDTTVFNCVLDTDDPSKLPLLKTGWADSAPACKLTPAASGSTGM